MKLIEAWRNNRLHEIEESSIIRVIATIESACNLSCEHCYWPHDIAREQSPDWSRSISYIKSKRLPVFFAGRILNQRGATFLREMINNDATDYLGIVDNGLTITNYPEFFKHWKSVNISIDGWREGHDRQRNSEGLFDKAWKTVMDLKESGLDPVISSAISPLTMHDWEKFEELLSLNDVPMSSTIVWNLPEAIKRNHAVFGSDEKIREAFTMLVCGIPKLINIYSIDYIRILADLLGKYTWCFDEECGDCIKTTLSSGTVIIYRPVSLVSVAELSLHWDGELYTPPTYGQKVLHDQVGQVFRESVRKLNEEEISVWSGITSL